MPKLSGAEDVRRGSDVGRSRTPAAIRFDGQGANRGLESAARSTIAAGRAVQGISNDMSVMAKQQERTNLERENYETNRRFLEFSASQEASAVERMNQVESGAFGLSDQVQSDHQKNAKKFLSSVPERLKQQYDGKLFGVEDRVFTKAFNHEKKVRKSYYNERTNEGLTLLEKNLRDNPDTIDQVYNEGRSYISALPDADVSPLEKQSMVKAWKLKAQMASLSGMRPHERLNAVGRGSSTLKVSGALKRQTGNRRIVSDAAAAHGQNPAVALGIVSIESNFKPNAKAKTSSASGFYQFIDSTGRQYGLDDSNVNDPHANADAGARLLRDNGDYLRNGTGREPSPGELYLAHFSGVGTALKLMRANPNAAASTVFTSDAVKANKSILEGKTVGEVISWANSKMAKHMRNAGVDVQEVPGDVPNPAFADLSIKDLDSIQKTAYAELRDENTSIDAIQREQTALAKAQATAHSERVGLLVETGELAAERDILADTALDDGEKTRHLKALRSKRKADKANSDAAQHALKTFSDPNYVFDPSDKDDKAAVDNVFQQITGGDLTDETKLATAVKMVGRTNFVPKAMEGALRSMIDQQDPDLVKQGFDAIDRVYSLNSQVAIRDFPKSVIDRLQDYKALQGFLPDDELMKAVQAPGSAVQAQMGKEREKEADKLLEDLTPEYILDQMDESYLPFTEPSAPSDPFVTARLSMDYKSIFSERYKRTGNADASHEDTIQRLRLRWGTSTFSRGELMRYPPERFYPLVEGSHDWLKEQATEELKDHLTDGKLLKAFSLVADRATETDIAAGKPPRYKVVLVGDEGLAPILDDAGRTLSIRFDPSSRLKKSRKQFSQDRAKLMKEDALRDVPEGVTMFDIWNKTAPRHAD